MTMPHPSLTSWKRVDGWSESYTAPFLSYFIFGQLFNSLWSFLGRSRCHRGGLLPQRDLLCHFQEQSCLLNPVLYWACESRIFRSITKMFLYVGAAPNRVNQRRQFRIQPRSVKYLVSDDWSQEWDSVICAGWGAFCGHDGAEFSFWYSAHHPLIQHHAEAVFSGCPRSCRQVSSAPGHLWSFFLGWLGGGEVSDRFRISRGLIVLFLLCEIKKHMAEVGGRMHLFSPFVVTTTDANGLKHWIVIQCLPPSRLLMGMLSVLHALLVAMSYQAHRSPLGGAEVHQLSHGPCYPLQGPLAQNTKCLLCLSVSTFIWNMKFGARRSLTLRFILWSGSVLLLCGLMIYW